MYLEGAPLAPLGTLQDTLLQAVWLRREQFRVFETAINVFASALSLDPKLSKKIEELNDEYINLVIPGTKELRKRNNEAFVAKTANALDEVTKLLSGYKGNMMSFGKQLSTNRACKKRGTIYEYK